MRQIARAVCTISSYLGLVNIKQTIKMSLYFEGIKLGVQEANNEDAGLYETM